MAKNFYLLNKKINFQDLFEKYEKSYNCVLKIKAFIEHEYSYNLSDEEQLYLIIHIERIVTKASI